jgi:hypothetical protein
MFPIKTLRYCFPALAFAACMAQAQTLDKSRIVYRCEHQGKITYADEPCVGAKEVDVTPTQGLDKSSGVSRKGAEVRRDEHRRQLVQALKPLDGRMDEKRFDQLVHRQPLSPEAQRACRQLDQQLPQLKAAESSASTESAKAQAEVNLFRARKAFKHLRC